MWNGSTVERQVNLPQHVSTPAVAATSSAPAKGTENAEPNGNAASSPKFELDTSSNRTEDVSAEPIVWEYLSFETELPAPTQLSSSGNGNRDLEPPDLSRFQNPFEWPARKKSALTWLSVTITVFTAYAAGMYEVGIPQMMAEWGVSQVALSVGITVFTIGFGVAPMVLAPFSEINGRRPVFLATGVLYLVSTILCAVVPNYPGFVVLRFLAGCSSSTFSTMVGGVVADIYKAKDRNTPMTLFTASALFGTGLGPMISGFISQHLDWRWMFWVLAIVLGMLCVLLFLVFDETRGSVLLSKKAKRLNKWYEAREEAGLYGVDMMVGGSGKKQSRRIRWKCKADDERTSLRKMIAISLYRPFHLLVTESVVFWFSLWASFCWGILYLQIGILAYTYETYYNFNIEQTGSTYMAISIGAIIMTFICIFQDKLWLRYGPKGPAPPEQRLYFACIESAFMPLGIFWFGWTVSSSIPWIVPTMGVAFASMGIFSIFLAVFNYLADSYHKYASSAIAAVSCCRNLVCGFFPLFTEAMYVKLGYGGASSVLGGFGLALTALPWILVFFGRTIRARSKVASQIMDL